jgi:hypothetical protein
LLDRLVGMAASERRVRLCGSCAIHSQYDIPALVDEARVPEGALPISTGAWSDHPLAIEAIRRKTKAQLDGGEANLRATEAVAARGVE